MGSDVDHEFDPASNAAAERIQAGLSTANSQRMYKTMYNKENAFKSTTERVSQQVADSGPTQAEHHSQREHMHQHLPQAAHASAESKGNPRHSSDDKVVSLNLSKLAEPLKGKHDVQHRTAVATPYKIEKSNNLPREALSQEKARNHKSME